MDNNRGLTLPDDVHCSKAPLPKLPIITANFVSCSLKYGVKKKGLKVGAWKYRAVNVL